MRLIRLSIDMKKITLLFAIILVVVSLGWLLRYKISYNYNVWKMEHTAEESDENKYNEKIQALSDKTGKSSFINTYSDTTKKNRVRRAAAAALIKSDPASAESLFGKYINSTNPEVAGMAIRDLGTMKSRKYKNEILQKRNSTNEIVRWSVADYFGNFQDGESIAILKNIRDNDNSEMVKYHAADGLKHLSEKSGS